MPRSIRYNPAKGYRSPHRKLAEAIAKDKGIKVKSAMRYIQRVIAPIGKQRINKPKFTGLKRQTQKLVKEQMQVFHRESLKQQLDKHVPTPLVRKALYDYIASDVESDFQQPVKTKSRLSGRSLLGDSSEELAIFTNLFGIEQASLLLNTSVEIINDYFADEMMFRKDIKRLEASLEDWKFDNQHTKEFAEIEQRGAVLREMRESISSPPYDDVESANIFRQAVALGKVNIEYLNRHAAMLWNELTNSQLKRILEAAYYEDFEGEVDLNMMFATFYADGKHVIARQGGFLDESVFWAWFRELFYAQTGD